MPSLKELWEEACLPASVRGPQDFWAFRRLARPAIPQVRPADRLRTAVDNFVEAALEERGFPVDVTVERSLGDP